MLIEASGLSGIAVTFLLPSNNLFRFLSNVIIIFRLVLNEKFINPKSTIKLSGIL